MKFESPYLRVMFGLMWLNVISETFWRINTGIGVTAFTFVLLIIGVMGLVSVFFGKKTQIGPLPKL
jgi:hypothetical protein